MASWPPVPQMVPVLSRGKHRKPSKGACFMELAAFLAGERWSDHPACTHPLLAKLARLVNDSTSDANRSRLAPLIPSVIGLTSDDLRMDARIVLRSARTALPVVAEGRQRVLAVSVITTERVLAALERRSPVGVAAESRHVLDSVPHAAAWAEQFAGQLGISAEGFRRHGAPTTVQCAVQGIAEACIGDADQLLHDLLAGAIRDCADLRTSPAVAPTDPADWASLCRLTAAR